MLTQNTLLSKQEGFPLLLSGIHWFLLMQNKWDTHSGPEIKCLCSRSWNARVIQVLKWDTSSFSFCPGHETCERCDSVIWKTWQDILIFNSWRTGFGKKSMQRVTSKREVSRGGNKRKASFRMNRAGVLVPACWLNSGIFFPQRKGHHPGNRREKKLKWIISQKSNLWLLHSDLHSAHNDDIFTAVIGLIT